MARFLACPTYHAVGPCEALLLKDLSPTFSWLTGVGTCNGKATVETERQVRELLGKL